MKSSMIQSLNIMNKILYLGLFLLLTNCDFIKKPTLVEYLSNDSIQMWDITMYNYIELRDTSYFHKFLRSISFDKNFQCEQYARIICCERIIDVLGPKPNHFGLCNKWELLNDSTVKLNCKDVLVVKIINRDTVHLIDTLGIKQHEMYRVSPPWNVDKESVLIKNKKIENGEYLENISY